MKPRAFSLYDIELKFGEFEFVIRGGVRYNSKGELVHYGEIDNRETESPSLQQIVLNYMVEISSTAYMLDTSVPDKTEETIYNLVKQAFESAMTGLSGQETHLTVNIS